MKKQEISGQRLVAAACRAVLLSGIVQTIYQVDCLRYERAQNGYPVNEVPSWHMTAWFPQGYALYENERWAGNVIRLDQSHYLMPSHSAQRVVTSPTTPTPNPYQAFLFRSLAQPARLAHPTPVEFDIQKGIKEAYYQVHHIFIANGSISNGPLCLLYEEPTQSVNAYRRPVEPVWTGSQPAWETNKHEFGHDCYAYGWTGRIGDERHVNGTDLKPMHRRYARWPVELVGHCQVGICRLRSRVASITHGTADGGTPVLCGKEKRLTYMYLPQFNTNLAEIAEAVHIPHFYQGIMDAWKISKRFNQNVPHSELPDDPPYENFHEWARELKEYYIRFFRSIFSRKA